MGLSDTQRKGFRKRISNIRKGGSNTMGELHIGPRDESTSRKSKNKNVVRVKQKNTKKVDVSQGSTLSILPLAVFFGGISMLMGQTLNFHLYAPGGVGQLPVPDFVPTDMAQFLPFAFGGVLLLLFIITFRFTSLLKFVAVGAGFWATFNYHIDLVKTFPGFYTGLYSKEYVEGVFAVL